MQDDDEDVEEICTPDLHVPSSDTRSSQSHVNQNVGTFCKQSESVLFPDCQF